MKTKRSNDLKNSNVFSALENRRPLVSQKTFKNIQPYKTNVVEKENRNSHVFISSPYKSNDLHHSPAYNQQQFKVVRQTFITNKNNERAEVTFAERPTMGGKTISSIHHLPASTTLQHHNRMSSQELKLLSRRINPHEPLSSPHASPKKPPLPNLTRKRLLKEKENIPTEQPKKKKAHYEFTCEPCKKVYTTRAGYIYHKDKCKYQKFKAASKAVISCICPHPTEDTGTMIECIKCNTWLHLKCAGGVTKEESYCCPRCIDITDSDTVHLFNHLAQVNNNEEEEDEEEEEEQFTFQHGKTINLSALCEAKERSKNLVQSFKETAKDKSTHLASVYSEENNRMLMSPSPQLPSAIVNDDFWNNSTDIWCNEDLPSLLFSDNNPSSFVDDFSANDIPSSPINQADWLHFANFDDDFTFQQ